MLRTVEAVVDERGKVRLLVPVQLVTIIEEEPAVSPLETAPLSEAALAGDWERSEEDEAWSHLQPAQ